MRKNLRTIQFVKPAALLLTLALLTANAAGTVAHAQTSGGFSMRAVIPENQVDTKQTYFDLRMQPGEEQTVQVIINNSREEDLVAQVSLNAASTARNGLIVYTEPDIRDTSMRLSVTDVAALQSQQVTVPALGSETVEINIKMPEDSFGGVILGGISVTGNEAGGDTQAAQGVSLKNSITYVTALKLTESDTEVPPDFELAGITPSLINYQTAVVATLRNKAARIVKNMEINAQVYRKGSDTVLHKLELSDAEMAPSSTGSFVINWEGNALIPGAYRLVMTADYEGRIWEWDEEFTIAGEANELNSGALNIKKNDTWFYFAFGLAALVLIWLMAYRAGKRRKNDGN